MGEEMKPLDTKIKFVEFVDKIPRCTDKETYDSWKELARTVPPPPIVDKFVNQAMQWGIEKEPEAKAAYETATGRIIQDVGFIDHPRIQFCGASPDGFVDDGLIEIKCPTTATHVAWILDGGIPEEHKAQMTLQAAVTGRSWVDFVSYDPRMPKPQQLLIRRFYPTAGEIAEIETEAEKFLAEVDALFDVITRREMIE
jgi:hypothetical protein